MSFSFSGLPMEDNFIFKKIISPELLQEAFKLRFQVYCYESQFLKESDYPQMYETDAYDKYSVHFGAFDSQERMVGTVRLILPTCERFPMEEHCPILAIDRDLIPRQNCAEVSRLIISKLYRRRAKDGLYYEPQIEDNNFEKEGKSFMRRMRPMAFGLYRLMYYECKCTGINHWLALMEKGLWTLLKIHGFVFLPIGSEVDFYGIVKPYIADIRDLERSVYSKFPHFLEYFTEGLEPDLQPKF